MKRGRDFRQDYRMNRIFEELRSEQLEFAIEYMYLSVRGELEMVISDQ